MRFGLAPLVMTVLLLAACSDKDKLPATASPGTSATPAVGPSASLRPGTTPAGSDGVGGIILNEVRFAAAPGAPAFVELKNTNAARSSSSGLVLKGSTTFPVPADAPEVEPGGVIVIAFDGDGATNGNILHALGSAFPGAAGEISLARGGGEVDQLRWVDAGAAAGGLVTTTPMPGWALARPPSATARSAPWTLVVPAGATPGAANAPAGVSLFGSDDRAIYSRPTVSLSWYSVPGATAYRLELASDAAFSTKVVDRTEDAVSPGGLSQESAEVGPLGAGRYYWRVTAVYNGTAGAVSAEQSFYIEPGGSAAVAGLGVVAAPVSLTAAAAAPVQLPVPHLFQRKDTAMLHLDNPAEGGARAWDEPDPAGSHNRPYCVRAVVAMVNHYYRGNLSLDRVGYEAFKDLRPGPELDLKESGADLDSLGRVASWALGVTVAEHRLRTEDAFIAAVRAEIDAKRPVFLVRTGHVVLVVGYATDDGHGNFGLVIQDGNQAAWVVSSWPDSRFVDRYAFYLTIPDGAAGTQQEAGVTRDGDRDGVVDFDETDRFGLSSGARDSDSDELDDKQDIRAGTWDERHGYARGGPGRDFDRDGIPMERDPDADAGGCFDGMEDDNRDGKFDSGVEIDNFEPGDDPCVGGTYLVVSDQVLTFDSGGSNHTLQNSRALISLEPEVGGRLTGRALVTYFLESQTFSDDPTCPLIEIPRVTSTGVSLLTGELVAGKLQIETDPDRGPPFSATVVGCGISESSDYDGAVWFSGWGLIEFTSGRYDYRADVPLPPGVTGEFYMEVHLRQPGS